MSAFSLTPYQRAFKNNVIKGMNPSEAYVNAGYKTDGMTPATIAREARRLMTHPNISPAIREGQDRATDEAITLASFTKQKALEWAQEDRDKARELNQMGSAVSAARLANDIAGHITEKKDVTVRGDPIGEMFDDIAGKSRAQPKEQVH